MLARYSFLILAIFCAVCTCKYDKLRFEECFATGTPVVKITQVDVSPMPIQTPIDINFNFKARISRQLQGKLKTTVTMYRKIGVLPALPVRCTIVDGVHMGSCTYDDLCEFMRLLSTKKEVNWVLGNLFKSFFGEETQCPISNSLQVDIDNNFTIPDLSKSIISLFMNGDYEVKIEVSDGKGYVGCWNLGYTILPRS